MPVDVRAAYDRVVDDMAPLHSGARLAAKLNAKIIINGNEFSNAGEMSVDDRHLYHEALEALFPPDTAVSATEPGESNRKERSSIVGAVKKRLSKAARVLRLKRLGYIVTPCGTRSTSTLVSRLRMGDPPSQLSHWRQRAPFHLVDRDCLPTSSRSKIRALRQPSIHLSLSNR